MNVRKTTIFFLLSLALFVGGFSIATSQQASAAYDGGSIIDNGVFLNANSMNAAQIQSFLVSKGSGLASQSFLLQCYGANSQERQLYTSVGAVCDQNMSAANIIYYASRIYGINPQVIMATLQKEQSLITTGNPTSSQLNQAMGYGCPTTGNCSGNSTFSYQIDSGTWALRYHYERANGNNNWWSASSTWVCGTEKNFYRPSLYPGQNVRFYDGNNVLYSTQYLANAATSSMYCYTPHTFNNFPGCVPAHGVSYDSSKPTIGNTGTCYSGSYNFVMYFEAWFGSTATQASNVYLSDGTYRLNTSSNKSLDVKNVGSADGTPVQIWDQNTFGSQYWQVTSTGDGFYKLMNPASGKYLDVTGFGTANGTKLQIWSNSTASCAQKWAIVNNADGYYLLSACSGRALDVTNGAVNTNGTSVQIWDRNNGVNQRWKFQVVP